MTTMFRFAECLCQGMQHTVVVVCARALECLCTATRHVSHFFRAVFRAFDRAVQMVRGPLQTLRTCLVEHTDAMLLHLFICFRVVFHSAGHLLHFIHRVVISWFSRAKVDFLLAMQHMLTSWQSIWRRMVSVCSHARSSLCIAMLFLSDLFWSLLEASGRAAKMVAEPMKKLTIDAMHAAFGLAVRLLQGIKTLVVSVCARASDALCLVIWCMSYSWRTMRQLLGRVATLMAPMCRQSITAVLATIHMAGHILQRVHHVVQMIGARLWDDFCVAMKLVSFFVGARLQVLGCAVIAVLEPVKIFFALTFAPMMCATFCYVQSVLCNMCSRMISVGNQAWYHVCIAFQSLSLLVSKLLQAVGHAAMKVLAFAAKSVCCTVCWVVHSIWRGVGYLAHTILLILVTIWITARNVVYRPRCSICKRGCAKLRSLCFTCAGDHLVPRCSDCGLGWCKVEKRCFSCFAERHFKRCEICEQGYRKIGMRCTTCFFDQFFHRCAACQRGYRKLGTSFCITCLADHLFCRCGVCRRGFCKIGTRCFSCSYLHVFNYLSQPPRCRVCSRGYQKVGTTCLSCYLDRFCQRCAVCQQGYKKAGNLCFTCYLDRFSCRCGVCHQGFAKIGTRCFTCFKMHITSFCHCGVCRQGYAKIGGRCFTCFKAHVINFPRCGVCRRGHAKFGTRCFTCFKAHVGDLLRNPPQCGLCHHGSAKIGSRCFTCHCALLGSGPRAGGKRAPGTRTLPKKYQMTSEDCCHGAMREERIPTQQVPLHATNHE
eukprot:gnl/MRDRNA2_/MRDRNA2_29202_c0_seq1.p1 gnl/MRDRNA2_/MRDRNA2_29202_c0~~gnl/MRDRNA2_/MRDRNA2_29202_c0_seq1.p1  ORF type:complete len:801 (-),score=29.07 gnl/MRDRNA2_/MRDRNA2_29202_c0_seq1:299-2596(-)